MARGPLYAVYHVFTLYSGLLYTDSPAEALYHNRHLDVVIRGPIPPSNTVDAGVFYSHRSFLLPEFFILTF